MIGAPLAVLVGLLVIGGLIALVVGFRTTPADQPQRPTRTAFQRWSAISRRPAGASGRRRDLFLIAAAVIGLVIAAASGWVVALFLVPAMALVLPAILATPKARDVELLEALDRWVRTLSAALPTGKSIPDAIRLSRRTAPEVIGSEVGVLVARLNNRWDSRVICNPTRRRCAMWRANGRAT